MAINRKRELLACVTEKSRWCHQELSRVSALLPSLLAPFLTWLSSHVVADVTTSSIGCQPPSGKACPFQEFWRSPGALTRWVSWASDDGGVIQPSYWPGPGIMPVLTSPSGKHPGSMKEIDIVVENIPTKKITALDRVPGEISQMLKEGKLLILQKLFQKRRDYVPPYFMRPALP